MTTPGNSLTENQTTNPQLSREFQAQRVCPTLFHPRVVYDPIPSLQLNLQFPSPNELLCPPMTLLYPTQLARLQQQQGAAPSLQPQQQTRQQTPTLLQMSPSAAFHSPQLLQQLMYPPATLHYSQPLQVIFPRVAIYNLPTSQMTSPHVLLRNASRTHLTPPQVASHNSSTLQFTSPGVGVHNSSTSPSTTRHAAIHSLSTSLVTSSQTIHSPSTSSVTSPQAIHSLSTSPATSSQTIHSPSTSSVTSSQTIHSLSTSSVTSPQAIHSLSTSPATSSQTIHSLSTSSVTSSQTIHSLSTSSVTSSQTIHSPSTSSVTSSQTIHSLSTSSVTSPQAIHSPSTLQSTSPQAIHSPTITPLTSLGVAIHSSSTSPPTTPHKAIHSPSRLQSISPHKAANSPRTSMLTSPQHSAIHGPSSSPETFSHEALHSSSTPPLTSLEVDVHSLTTSPSVSSDVAVHIPLTLQSIRSRNISPLTSSEVAAHSPCSSRLTSPQTTLQNQSTTQLSHPRVAVNNPQPSQVPMFPQVALHNPQSPQLMSSQAALQQRPRPLQQPFFRNCTGSVPNVHPTLSPFVGFANPLLHFPTEQVVRRKLNLNSLQNGHLRSTSSLPEDDAQYMNPEMVNLPPLNSRNCAALRSGISLKLFVSGVHPHLDRSQLENVLRRFGAAEFERYYRAERPPAPREASQSLGKSFYVLFDDETQLKHLISQCAYYYVNKEYFYSFLSHDHVLYWIQLVPWLGGDHYWCSNRQYTMTYDKIINISNVCGNLSATRLVQQLAITFGQVDVCLLHMNGFSETEDFYPAGTGAVVFASAAVRDRAILANKILVNTATHSSTLYISPYVGYNGNPEEAILDPALSMMVECAEALTL